MYKMTGRFKDNVIHTVYQFKKVWVNVLSLTLYKTFEAIVYDVIVYEYCSNCGRCYNNNDSCCSKCGKIRTDDSSFIEIPFEQSMKELFAIKTARIICNTHTRDNKTIQSWKMYEMVILSKS